LLFSFSDIVLGFIGLRRIQYFNIVSSFINRCDEFSVIYNLIAGGSTYGYYLLHKHSNFYPEIDYNILSFAGTSDIE